MGAAGTTPEPEAPTQSGLTFLGEVACRYQADEIGPEDLPMFAAEALATGLDTPAWAAELRIAALALTSSPPIGPGC
ncbi:hypothetical protein SSOG_07246 [Streptomyces himastatinicus ATCC 53653]|uniref:Uncharacterized protein n=1 Tax=Streptomyces himastatinicus ATCC 53653 TaxID=457427 RepID=D9WH52_9ACTN|nr:hypothetical protein SSOG_07246 [Streptomyces himastatinicus ATCC 53653]